jgi:hypothetical protein
VQQSPAVLHGSPTSWQMTPPQVVTTPSPVFTSLQRSGAQQSSLASQGRPRFAQQFPAGVWSPDSAAESRRTPQAK